MSALDPHAAAQTTPRGPYGAAACYFEDLTVGEIRRSEPKTVSREELLGWARQYDPQYFHVDEHLAESSIFEGLIAPGIYTAALWRQLDHSINSDVAFVCGYGWDEVRWPNPVRPGDILVAESEVLEKEPHPKRPGMGKVLYGYRVINQDGDIVMSFRSRNLVEMKP